MPDLKDFSDVTQALKPYIQLQNSMRGAYTLMRIKTFMKLIGSPQHAYKVIHVAGTSGKTSTAYYIAAYLTAAGKKVGLTASPHIDCINERVQVDMVPTPEADFCNAFGEFLDIVIASKVKLTYFEVLVAFAYWYYARIGAEYVVMEVGLGGLLDATNVISQEDKICVITDIGLDHTNILGKTVGEIASQKGGIITHRNTVFMYSQQPKVNEVLIEIALQQQARLKLIDANMISRDDSLPLYQQRNRYLSQQVFEYIRHHNSWPAIDEANVINPYIPARMETITFKDKIIIMDGAHNEQKIAALVESVRARYPGKRVAVLASFVKSQNSRSKAALYELLPLTNNLILTSFGGPVDGPKASVAPNRLAEYCHDKGFNEWRIVHDPEEALSVLLEQPEEILLITGSFYLMNHIRPEINKMLQKQG